MSSLQKRHLQWRFLYLWGQQHFLFQWTRGFFDEIYALRTGLKVSNIWNFAQFFFVSKFTYRPNCYNLFLKHQEKYFTMVAKQRAGSIFKVWSISQKQDCPIGILYLATITQLHFCDHVTSKNISLQEVYKISFSIWLYFIWGLASSSCIKLKMRANAMLNGFHLYSST